MANGCMQREFFWVENRRFYLARVGDREVMREGTCAEAVRAEVAEMLGVETWEVDVTEV